MARVTALCCSALLSLSLLPGNKFFTVRQPLFSKASFAIEFRRQLFEPFLPKNLFAQCQFAFVFGTLEILPCAVDVRDHFALSRLIRDLLVGTFLALEGEEKHFEIALLGKSAWFVHHTIAIEFDQAFLHTSERIGKLSIVEHANGLVDPGQQVGHEPFVLVGHLLGIERRADHFGQAAALHAVILSLGEVVVEGDDVGNDGLVVHVFHVDIFGIEQFTDAQTLFADVEGELQIVIGILFRQGAVLWNEIRPMLVYQGTERESILPRRGEVANINIGVIGCFHLAPEQESILGRFGLSGFVLFDGDVLNLKTKDNCPYQAENEG